MQLRWDDIIISNLDVPFYGSCPQWWSRESSGQSLAGCCPQYTACDLSRRWTQQGPCFGTKVRRGCFFLFFCLFFCHRLEKFNEYYYFPLNNFFCFSPLCSSRACSALSSQRLSAALECHAVPLWRVAGGRVAVQLPPGHSSILALLCHCPRSQPADNAHATGTAKVPVFWCGPGCLIKQ